jgi:hypothetical protein
MKTINLFELLLNEGILATVVPSGVSKGVELGFKEVRDGQVGWRFQSVQVQERNQGSEPGDLLGLSEPVNCIFYTQEGGQQWKLGSEGRARTSTLDCKVAEGGFDASLLEWRILAATLGKIVHCP